MTRSIQVVPAILTDKAETLKAMLDQVKTFTDYAQIDIMDGHFVPSLSISWQVLSKTPIDISWEAHIMIERPEDSLEQFRKAGAKKVVFHFEATQVPRRVIALGKKLKLEMGVAVNPETPVSKVMALTSEVDSVLFLSVHPGFYGAKFIPETLEKIKELKQARPKLTIGIDGGIKEANIVEIAQSGVDQIFVGSAIFLQPEPAESYRRLLSLARNA
jgi:ribulose-phosphate 3-epimerase